MSMSSASSRMPDAAEVICFVDVALFRWPVAVLLMKGVPIAAAPKLSVVSGAVRRVIR